MQEIGRYFDEGFARGIDEGAGDIVARVREVSRMASDAALAQALERPVQRVDIDYDRLEGIARGKGRGDVTINQNNYSPKALTPYETARQTRQAARELAMMWNR